MTSFPKAKIHRFNEDISCAPPPGTYDPKLDSKVKGAPIQKGKRFPDQQYISSSLDNLDRDSSNIHMTFRTPQVMRKVLLTPKIKKGFDTPGSSSSVSSGATDKRLNTPGLKKTKSSTDYHRLEQELNTLAEKHLVEINVLNSEIFKLQDTLIEVEKREAEIKLILEEKSALASERHNELLKVKHNLDTVEDMIRKEREDHKKYIEDLKEEISKLETKREDLEGIIAEKQSAIVTINDKYIIIVEELAMVKEENEKYKNEIERIEEVNSGLLSRLVLESEERIDQLEESLKNRVNKFEKECLSSQESVQEEFQTIINYFVTHEFELKKQEFEGQLKTCHSKIRELRKMVERNEKEFMERIKEVDERCKLIYRELCKVEDQRDDLLKSDLEKKLTIIEVQEQANCFEENLKSCKDKCKKYEITLSTMQGTIQALSDRLLESENEVIRLNSVEVDLESQKKCLEEKSQILMSDITALRESIERMEKEIVYDVTLLKEHLAAKVDYFKIEATKKVDILNDEIRDKQSIIDRLTNELGDAKDLISELEYLKLDNKNNVSELNSKIEDYELTISNTETQLFLLQNEKNKLLISIESLKEQIKSNEEVIEMQSQNEVKQQQHIDGLLSDLIFEKNRCDSLESEKNQMKSELSEAQITNRENEQELKELYSKFESMNRTLKNLEEKVTLTDEDKGILEMQLLKAENNSLELKNANELLSKANEELENIIKGLHQSLNLTKEQIKTEIPNLERDSCNKAARILELSINIDSLTDIVKSSEVKISCLEAEKESLSLQLDEVNTKNSELQNALDSKNITIDTLTEHVKIEKAKYEDYVAETDKIFNTLKKHNEVLKINADNGIKLQEADEKINKLEEELRAEQTKLTNSKTLEAETKKMREEMEVMSLKLQVVTEERNKLDYELAELMGHQNKHQKIKHVNQLKQNNIELREKADNLEIENARLKKRLAEFKENANIPRNENTPRSTKNKTNKTSSPAVLKDRNC